MELYQKREEMACKPIISLHYSYNKVGKTYFYLFLFLTSLYHLRHTTWYSRGWSAESVYILHVLVSMVRMIVFQSFSQNVIQTTVGRKDLGNTKRVWVEIFYLWIRGECYCTIEKNRFSTPTVYLSDDMTQVIKWIYMLSSLILPSFSPFHKTMS